MILTTGKCYKYPFSVLISLLIPLVPLAAAAPLVSGLTVDLMLGINLSLTFPPYIFRKEWQSFNSWNIKSFCRPANSSHIPRVHPVFANWRIDVIYYCNVTDLRDFEFSSDRFERLVLALCPFGDVAHALISDATPVHQLTLLALRAGLQSAESHHIWQSVQHLQTQNKNSNNMFVYQAVENYYCSKQYTYHNVRY